MIDKKCVGCGNTFSSHRCHHTKYCSRACYFKYGKNPFYGRRHTNNSLIKMSLSKIGKPSKLKGTKRLDIMGDNNPSKRPEVRAKISVYWKGRPNPFLSRMNKDKNFIAKQQTSKKGFHHTEESKRIISLHRIGKGAGASNGSKRPEVKLKIKQNRKPPIITNELRAKMRANRLSQRFPSKYTSIERRLGDALRNKQISFTTHITVLGITQPDIIIDGKKVAIYADGCWWHGCPIHYPVSESKSLIPSQNATKDTRITQLLKDDGWVVMRFWEHDINGNIDECVDVVTSKI